MSNFLEDLTDNAPFQSRAAYRRSSVQQPGRIGVSNSLNLHGRGRLPEKGLAQGPTTITMAEEGSLSASPFRRSLRQHVVSCHTGH